MLDGQKHNTILGQMMSKERELLERVMYRIPSSTISEHDLDLVDDIKELLAQPEQEPETMEDIWGLFNAVFVGATIQKSLAQELIIKAHHRGVEVAKGEPLITDALEFLVDEYKGFPMSLCRAIEAAHGIGVDTNGN